MENLMAHMRAKHSCCQSCTALDAARVMLAGVRLVQVGIYVELSLLFKSSFKRVCLSVACDVQWVGRESEKLWLFGRGHPCTPAV